MLVFFALIAVNGENLRMELSLRIFDSLIAEGTSGAVFLIGSRWELCGISAESSAGASIKGQRGHSTVPRHQKLPDFDFLRSLSRKESSSSVNFTSISYTSKAGPPSGDSQAAQGSIISIKNSIRSMIKQKMRR